MARARRPAPLPATLLGLLGLLAVAAGAGCAAEPERSARRPAGSTSTGPSSSPPSPTRTPTSTPTSSSPSPTPPATETPARPEPARSFLSIPRLGLADFPVVRYRGSPDDAVGTRLQNDGSLASPRGRSGGEAPGEIGNYIVTGHRLSSTEPFRYLPSLPNGSRVRIRVADVVHVYEVRRTRWTSFRSRASLAAQRAAVPGRPGVAATRAMITLSTCATIEDHAAGNYWADEFDNPEHRIEKIGVLVATRPA
ncbi:class E sortase [Nocardioides currus]|uniref:Sortase n=1 Tax=Nocardioides currus TaxID=2133958 RepID=A0A2R7Z0A8_9ACTN|nr:class E sortase [Nocardioides currus]PUA81716.1 sortase [Nocardioides currus]